ncbi:MAG: NUDIX hydrolase [Muribaculaceae bacterium]|jgi:8-oxo-dGTP diphosphatase|nr:NUDIX hydrolase [Muribaculaceae bacterium]MBO7165379.1 NUDIX hydrolase [Muribaculaceae bacterium]MBQ1184932.1 NUDIX hydrolase [Muribaculaceae bacterium]MBQ2398866.1 NUDIX hydrolase [Muribaculaceae bacterium]MBQ5723604.1 NUDIX hydrolase [Muribaculaceae bacterium]
MDNENKYCYKYPHAALTADCVVFGFDGESLAVLLIERGIEPFKGRWALPGGFMRMDETITECARRELLEETGVDIEFVEQFNTFSSVDRDPRERVVTVAHYALVRKSDYKVMAGDDAVKAKWWNIKELPTLAFDHDSILRCAERVLRERIHFEPIGFNLLDEKFTISELQRLYEAILGVQFDRRNFHKKITGLGILVPLDEKDTSGRGRSGQLYSFNEREYNALKDKGMKLEF